MIIEKIDTGYENIANCYLLVDEATNEAAVVDPGAGDKRNKIYERIEELQCTLKYILLTHGHFDHILGVYPIKKKYGCEVAIGKEDEMCLGDTTLSLAADHGLEHLQYPVRAEILLEEGSEIKLGDTVIKVMHTPGHTKGSLCFVIESERTILTGDTLFCLTVGRTDFPGGDSLEMLASVTRLASLEGDYRILPGHNRETTLAGERVRNRFIRRMK